MGQRFTRRRTWSLALGLALAGALGAGAAMAAAAASVPAHEPDDMSLGSPRARVTVIEYASVGCPHCAAWNNEVFAAFKAKFIDTGKARLVVREMLTGDPAIAAAGFMLARCAGDDKYYAMIDLLFDKQNDWAFVKKPVDALAALTKQAGFTQKSFEECLKNQEIRAGVEAVRSRAGTILGVDATPTFFINGKKYDGEMSFEAMDKIIAPIVNS